MAEQLVSIQIQAATPGLETTLANWNALNLSLTQTLQLAPQDQAALASLATATQGNTTALSALTAKLGEHKTASEGAAEGHNLLSTALTRVGGAAGVGGEQLGLMTEGLGALTAGGGLATAAMAGLGIGIAALAAGAVAEATHSFIEMSDAMRAMSETTGISQNTLQAFGYVASSVGESADGAQRALVVMQRNTQTLSDELAKGKEPSSKFAEALTTLGISLRSFVDASPDQQLRLMMDGFARLPEGAAKGALAMEIAGRGAASLVPALSQGSAALDTWMSRMDAAGAGVGATQAEVLQLHEATTKLDVAEQGLSNTIGSLVVPVMADAAVFAAKMAGALHDAIGGLGDLNQKLHDLHLPDLGTIATWINPITRAREEVNLLDEAFAKLAGTSEPSDAALAWLEKQGLIAHTAATETKGLSQADEEAAQSTVMHAAALERYTTTQITSSLATLKQADELEKVIALANTAAGSTGKTTAANVLYAQAVKDAALNDGEWTNRQAALTKAVEAGKNSKDAATIATGLSAKAQLDESTAVRAVGVDVAATALRHAELAVALKNISASTPTQAIQLLTAAMRDGTFAPKEMESATKAMLAAIKTEEPQQQIADLRAMFDAGTISVQQFTTDGLKAWETELSQAASGPTKDIEREIGLINDGLRGTKEQAQDAKDKLDGLFGAPTKEMSGLSAQIAGNKDKQAAWNETLANSSPIDQRIAALVKQQDQEIRTGASTEQRARTEADLNAQLAAVPAAEGAAIVSHQRDADALDQSTLALQAHLDKLKTDNEALKAGVDAANPHLATQSQLAVLAAAAVKPLSDEAAGILAVGNNAKTATGQINDMVAALNGLAQIQPIGAGGARTSSSGYAGEQWDRLINGGAAQPSGGRYPFAGSYPMTQGFGATEYAQTSGREPNGFHAGVDFGLPMDTPVDASRSGRVVQAGANGGYGNSVTIDVGNGVTELYGHLDSFAVAVGDLVQAGQQIGLSGNTGNSDGPHLHFEVDVNGKPVDPMGYLGGSINVTTGAGATPAGTGNMIMPASWYAAIQAHESSLPLPSPGSPQPMFGFIPGAPGNVGTGYYTSGGGAQGSAALGLQPGQTAQSLFPDVATGIAALNATVRGIPAAVAAIQAGDFAAFMNAINPIYAPYDPKFASQVIANFNPNATFPGGGASPNAATAGGYGTPGQNPVPSPGTAATGAQDVADLTAAGKAAMTAWLDTFHVYAQQVKDGNVQLTQEQIAEITRWRDAARASVSDLQAPYQAAIANLTALAQAGSGASAEQLRDARAAVDALGAQIAEQRAVSDSTDQLLQQQTQSRINQANAVSAARRRLAADDNDFDKALGLDGKENYASVTAAKLAADEQKATATQSIAIAAVQAEQAADAELLAAQLSGDQQRIASAGIVAADARQHAQEALSDEAAAQSRATEDRAALKQQQGQDRAYNRAADRADVTAARDTAQERTASTPEERARLAAGASGAQGIAAANRQAQADYDAAVAAQQQAQREVDRFKQLAGDTSQPDWVRAAAAADLPGAVTKLNKAIDHTASVVDTNSDKIQAATDAAADNTAALQGNTKAATAAAAAAASTPSGGSWNSVTGADFGTPPSRASMQWVPGTPASGPGQPGTPPSLQPTGGTEPSFSAPTFGALYAPVGGWSFWEMNAMLTQQSEMAKQWQHPIVVHVLFDSKEVGRAMGNAYSDRGIQVGISRLRR